VSLARSRPELGRAPFERLLREKFGAMRYIWLRRRNQIAQGISYYRATQTGVWRSVKGRGDQDSPLDKQLEFDFAKIQRAIATLRDGDWQWNAYFQRHRITPLMITYEDMVVNFEATVRGVLQYLGIERRDGVIAEPDLERQADDRSHDWEERYRELAAEDVPMCSSQVDAPQAPPTGADEATSTEHADDATLVDQAASSRTFDDLRMARLCEIIKVKSVVRGGGAKIVSPRGVPNSWLIDLRKTFLDPVGLDIVTELFWERFADKLPFQVGGLEMGAVPLISAIMLKGLQRGTPVNGFVVRKERKNYGLTKTYEGEITDDPIVVVDDLINSASTQEKVRVVVAEAGQSIREVFVVVNYRSKRGRDWLSRHKVGITWLFELSDFDLTLGGQKRQGEMANFALAWRIVAPEPNYFDVVPKSTPVVDDRHVYFGSDSGELWAADLRSGEVAWRFRARSPTRKRIFSSPAVLDGRVYFGSYNGNVYCLDGATGREIWRFGEADWIGSSPAIAPDLNMLFIGLEHELEGRRGSVVALDLVSGAKIWEYAVENFLHGSPAYDPDRRLVAVGTNDNDLLLIDPTTRSLRWRYKAKGAIRYAPAFDGARNTVICGSSDGLIHVVDVDSGEATWKVRTEDMIYSTPLIVGDRAYVASTDKFVYVLDLADQRVVKKIHTGAKNFASPRLIGGRVYGANTSGRIFEVDLTTFQVTGQVQLPERITNAVAYSERTGLFYAMTYDTALHAFRRT
jgi:outer membrane protein assembly factor BamB/LPS sulfotransferase NodH